MATVHVRVQTIEDKIARYVEDHPNEIYVDYRDELSTEQVEEILKGNAWEVRDEITMSWNEGVDLDYYWQECAEEVGCSREDIDDWLSSDKGFWPSDSMDDYEWRKLLRNTSVNIEAVIWDAEFNFNNWAYGGPVTYSDVKETLKLFGINPKEFHDQVKGGSMTAGDGKLKGWFPDMPDRTPKIKVQDIWDGMCSLYDGVVVFCLGDLENVADILAEESKEVTFCKGTNVVIYEFGGGAGITDFPLIEDLTIPRKNVDFRVSGKYGVQDCYGFTNSYWNEGAISLKGGK